MKKKMKKRGMGFGFFMQPSKSFDTQYFQSKNLYLSRFRETKTQLFYMSLAINVVS